jgi:hypothetical protein
MTTFLAALAIAFGLPGLAVAAQFARNSVDEFRRPPGSRVASMAFGSAERKPEAASAAVYCQTEPLCRSGVR